MSINTPDPPLPHRHASASASELVEQALKKEFAYQDWGEQWPTVRLMILRARENNECAICAIAEAKERGEIKSPPRCATHYDKSVLTELSVGGYRCNTCGQFVWPRETSITTE